MLQETRPVVLGRYLRVFVQGKLPRLDARIFQWARSRDASLHHSAMVALSNIRHREVRAFALERLRRKDGAPDWQALGLIERNHANGDGRWIQRILPMSGNPHVLHGIGLDLSSIAEAHPDEAMAACLEWVYERTPCSLCRARAVRGLIRLCRAPLWLLREAVHDADGQTRQVAAKALKRRERLQPLSGRSRGETLRK